MSATTHAESQPPGRSRRKRRWLRFALLLFTAVILAVIARYVEIWYDSQFDGARGPYLQRPGPDAISIHWQTEKPEIAHVVYRLLSPSSAIALIDDPAAHHSIAPAQPVRRHHHRLQDLLPDQIYEYAIVENGEISAGSYRFHTWPRPEVTSRPVRLWVLGDPGLDSAMAHRVRHAAFEWLMAHPRGTGSADPWQTSGPFPEQASRQFPELPLLDLWLTTGDNAYRSGRNAEYQAALFAPYQDALAHYALFPAYGNHDARRWAFFEIFDFPAAAESGGVASQSEHYYGLDYGPLHLVMLDSQASTLTVDSAMLRWLQADLEANTARWTVAVFHHPPYSRGSHDSDDDGGSDWRMRAVREVVLPVLEAHGVDVVLSGHSHGYERSHLLAGHFGTSVGFGGGHVIDAGERVRLRVDATEAHATDEPAFASDFAYRQPDGCGSRCGTMYIVVGNSAKLTPGSFDHPALPVAMMRGGSLMLDVEGDCLYGHMIADDYSVADAFSIAKGSKVCTGLSATPVKSR